MLLGGMSKYAVLIMAGALVVISLGGWLYYSHSQSELAKLTSNVAALQSATEIQESTIQSYLRASETQNYEISALQHALQNAEHVRRQTESRLRRANLEAEARLNSADLERRLNQATQQAFSEIEQLTGGAAATPVVPPPTTPAEGTR